MDARITSAIPLKNVLTPQQSSRFASAGLSVAWDGGIRKCFVISFMRRLATQAAEHHYARKSFE